MTSAAPVVVRGATPGSPSRARDGRRRGARHRRCHRAGLVADPGPRVVGDGYLDVTGRSGVRRFPNLHYAGGDVVNSTASVVEG